MHEKHGYGDCSCDETKRRGSVFISTQEKKTQGFCSGKWVCKSFALYPAEIEKITGFLKGRRGLNLRRWSREQPKMFTDSAERDFIVDF